MHENIEPWQTWIFIGSLALIAITINGIVRPYRPEMPLERVTTREPVATQTDERTRSAGSSESSREHSTLPPVAVSRQSSFVQPPEPIRVSEKTPEELAAERAKYLARYLNPGFVRNAGAEMVAVAVAGEDGKLNGSLGRAIASHFKSGTIQTSSSLFTPQFVSDGLFAQALEDLHSVATNLEFTSLLDVLLLANQRVEYSTNPSLENLITASMELEVTALSVKRRGENQTWRFRGNGAGFKQGDARAQAEERIMTQITKATDMVPQLMALNHP
ncbi:MAG: hypothetical protein MN733_19225 [Nitrososphaera sp.]|nr:hypothetical protein [Nitrososphaera sp.]